MIEIFETILDFLISYPEILSFLSPILGGENGVILVSFLAANGAFSIFTVFIFAFLGMVTVDSLWFFFPKTKLYKRMTNAKKISANYKKIEKRLEQLSYGKDVLILMLSKILVGTRILVIIFVGARKMKYGRFLSVILLPNLVWAGILVFIGFLARSSYEATISTFKNVQIAIFAAVLFIVLFYFLVNWLNNWVMRKV